ncbi:MAG: SMI1/KNR4 family protein [Oligoflexia bacterium]|nr:SMI1/KNR4 family protein [Oligoflexia bacterium]
MKIKLTKGHAVALNDVAALQRKLGESLTSEFLEFVAENDGAEPEINIFKIGTTNESGVSGFIPVKEIASEMPRIENLPGRSYPVAWVEGGNYVFINQAVGGAVFFWDHEQPDRVVRLADNFRSFLNSLEPFDVTSIRLQPGQVKKAWIDRDFFKGF